MAGFDSGGDEELIAGINVTPMVDIVLVLLIIFMVTTSYIVRAQIEVDLPRAASGQSDVQTTAAIQIKADGTYALNGETMTLKQIGEWVVAEKEGNPDLRAVIAADRKVEYERVVDVIDTVKVNGVEKFALNIVRKAGGVP
jgi:biopolymer transport protein ExbD